MKPEARVDAPVGDFQYDHNDPIIAAAPFNLWRDFRQECPVAHSDRYGGFWFVSRYDDVRQVAMDWKVFTATNGITIPRQSALILPSEVDPPDHRQYRSIINPPLSPQRISLHEDWIREEARQRIADLGGRKEFDACEDYCGPFTKRAALRLLGFPEEDLDQLDHWTHPLAGGARGEEEGAQAAASLFEYLGEKLAAAAEVPESESLISTIAHGSVGDRALSSEEQLSLLFLLTLGGLHTTSAVLSGAVVWLAQHPNDAERLRNDEDLMTNAIEEFVRYVSASTHLARSAACDMTLRDQRISAGDMIMFGIGSANHDETVFDDPDEVILDRFPNLHLGFGAGPHRCVGSNFAKLAIRVGLEEFLLAFESFELTDESLLEYRGGEACGLVRAPLRAVRTS